MTEIVEVQLAVADSTTEPRHAPQDKSLEMAGLVAPPQPAGAAVADEGEPQAPEALDSTTDAMDDEFLNWECDSEGEVYEVNDVEDEEQESDE